MSGVYYFCLSAQISKGILPIARRCSAVVSLLTVSLEAVIGVVDIQLHLRSSGQQPKLYTIDHSDYKMVTQFFQLKQHEVESVLHQGGGSVTLPQGCSSSVGACVMTSAASMISSSASSSACEFEAVFVPVKRAPGKRQATRVVTN